MADLDLLVLPVSLTVILKFKQLCIDKYYPSKLAVSRSIVQSSNKFFYSTLQIRSCN